jgi:hypothetical protein
VPEETAKLQNGGMWKFFLRVNITGIVAGKVMGM